MIKIDRVLSREVPTEWLRDLRAISPVSRFHSWLDFRWLPARKVHPSGEVVDRGRWCLYEWIPRRGIPADMVRMLSDRPPRLLPKGQQAGRSLFVDDYAHEMYRTHQCWVRPFWAIQGSDGGHPVEYNDLETEWRKLAGLPTVAPKIGALPYADFDNRVIQNVLMHDRLVRAGLDLDALTKMSTNDALKREAEEGQRALRAQYVGWLKGELAASTDFLTDYSRKTEADRTLRPATKQEENAAARLEDEFIATGLVPAA